MTKEEKEKLIELSDLNREDNVKYISSEAQGIAITLDSDRYAPTLCKLERAYICGRRKSENRITELEEENAELKDYRLTTVAKQQTEMSKYALNLEHKLSWYDNQLIKAKEIIKELMSFSVQLCDCRHTVDFEKTREKAEQFLKEYE